MSALDVNSPNTAAMSFGRMLRDWRSARGVSQLALSVQTSVSTRHLSYMETGRASPSREMVLLLAQALEMSLRDKNAFLQAAGFAPIYSQTPLEAHAMGPVRHAIELLLHSTEPNPTLVVNRRYDVLNANETGKWILATFAEDLASFPAPYNLGRLLASRNGMRPYVENWADVARKVFTRLRRELGGVHIRESADEDLLNIIREVWGEIPDPLASSEAAPLMVPVRLRRGATRLSLFTTIATLGTPLDVTLQELRIEMLFPADDQTRRSLETRPHSS
jgi:transcriptional regulator with XRE-family HTH domain